MSFGSMPAWAIASLAALTTSDSEVSPSSLPNLPWDQPTMQAVMRCSLLGAYTLVCRPRPFKGGHRPNSAAQPSFAMLEDHVRSRRATRPSSRWASPPPLALDPGRPAGRLPAARRRAGAGLVPVLPADRERGRAVAGAAAARAAGSRPGTGEGAGGPDRQAEGGQ